MSAVFSDLHLIEFSFSHLNFDFSAIAKQFLYNFHFYLKNEIFIYE
jgi:hypothetical protein